MVFGQEKMEAVKELLSGSKNIIITSHKSPDGDAVGSSLALCQVLKAMGHTVTIILPDRFPDFLTWLEGSSEVRIFERGPKHAERLILESDIIFSLDYNALHRIGDMGVRVAQHDGVKIMIDHHQSPDDFADYSFSDTSSCSTAQMIYEFIDALGKKELISVAAGEAMYCGIMTDTGSFKFPSTNATTHRIVANLLELGVDNTKVHNSVFDNNTEARLKLLGYSISEKLVVLPEHNTAFIALTSTELDRFKYKKGDTEGIVNYCLSIKGIQMAAFMAEKDGMIKISFRSKGDIPVNELSNEHFEGGGHINAAGGRSMDGMENTIEKFKNALPDFFATNK